MPTLKKYIDTQLTRETVYLDMSVLNQIVSTFVYVSHARRDLLVTGVTQNTVSGLRYMLRRMYVRPHINGT